MKDGMLLFHGSYAPIETIDLEKCRDGRDFGKGFYLTSSVVQARNFINTSIQKARRLGNAALDQDFGYISSFRFHAGELKVFEFEKASSEWLWFVALNRRPYLGTTLAERISKEIFQADVIIGKVANDKTNITITAYLNGLYGDILSENAVDDAVKALLPNQLDDQYCFFTEKAIQCLEFQEARKYDI